MQSRSVIPVSLVLAIILLSLAGCESVSSTPSPASSPATAMEEPLPNRADRAVLEKSKRLLTLYHNQRPFLSYRVSLGRNPVGAKTCSGDYRTPEGQYTIVAQNPASRFYRSLRLSYPNTTDIARAREQGCDPGNNVAIHGLENGYEWVGRAHRDADWTSGCIAVTNQEMDLLWRLMPKGTPVEILP